MAPMLQMVENSGDTQLIEDGSGDVANSMKLLTLYYGITATTLQNCCRD